MAASDDILRYVDECISEGNTYLNLDTNRKNKETTVSKKRNIYMSHDLRIFSTDLDKLIESIDYLKTYYPNISTDIESPDFSVVKKSSKIKDDDSGKEKIDETIDDLISTAFGTINRLLISPLIRNTTNINRYSFIPDDLFVSPKSSQPKSSRQKSSQPKSSQPKSSQPKSSQTKSSQPKSSQTKSSQTKSSQPKSSQSKSSQPKSSQSKSSQQKSSQLKSSGTKEKSAQPKNGENSEDEKRGSQSIPAMTRSQVWRKWCGNVMDGRCFCCDNEILYEKWHCGHIISREHGGDVSAENLRPTCKDCNLGMGTMHMYEWIMMNRLSGYRHLDPNDSVVRHNLAIVQATAKTAEKIEWLEINKHITRTQANGYRRRIVSKRSDVESRVKLMEEISDIFILRSRDLFPSEE